MLEADGYISNHSAVKHANSFHLEVYYSYGFETGILHIKIIHMLYIY